MTDTSAIDAAARRLSLALEALAAAAERRMDSDRGDKTLADQLHDLGSDRSRLASELDAAVAHARQLEGHHHDVAQRLDDAIETVRAVLETAER